MNHVISTYDNWKDINFINLYHDKEFVITEVRWGYSFLISERFMFPEVITITIIWPVSKVLLFWSWNNLGSIPNIKMIVWDLCYNSKPIFTKSSFLQNVLHCIGLLIVFLSSFSVSFTLFLKIERKIWLQKKTSL